MDSRIGGQKPRPRVALLGDFETNDIEHFRRMFPTIWSAQDIISLNELVDAREIDLIVIASGIEDLDNWGEKTHIICFSRDIFRLPGPVSYSYIRKSGNAKTEEFLFPDVPLPLSRRREADYANLTSIRGWPCISLRFDLSYGQPIAKPTKQKAATDIFNRGAIICEHYTNLPLAIAFLREDTNLGVSWLPSVDTNRAAWVDILVTRWAQSDKDAFPRFGDWMDSPEWMVVEEEKILSQIQALGQKKQKFIIEIDKQIGKLTTKLSFEKAKANKGQRRLIISQGEELVDEVAKTLKDIGFNVTYVDQLVGVKGTRREDLRLRHSGEGGEEWNAIVEVRGYTRSGGTTADLLRLNRFADLYKKETGQDPDKRIYIVNSQLELSPSQRQEPLASATEDLQIFSESDGILIWSVDLFRAIKVTNPTDYSALLESIKCAHGRWTTVDVPSPKEK